MRKIFITSLLTVLLALVSCNGDDLGFPSSVNFSKDGGSMIIKGKDMPYGASFEILNYNGDGISAFAPNENDSIIGTYKWLTAKMKMYDNKIELIAEPSDQSNKRTLYLYIDSGGDTAEITVTQK